MSALAAGVEVGAAPGPVRAAADEQRFRAGAFSAGAGDMGAATAAATGAILTAQPVGGPRVQLDTAIGSMAGTIGSGGVVGDPGSIMASSAGVRAARAAGMASGPLDPVGAAGAAEKFQGIKETADRLAEAAIGRPIGEGTPGDPLRASRDAMTEKERRKLEEQRRRERRQAARRMAQKRAKRKVEALYRRPAELELIEFLVKQDRLAEADKMLRDVSEVQRKKLDKEDRGLAPTFVSTSVVRVAQRRVDDAREAAERALELCELAGGHPGARDMREATEQRVRVFQSEGEWEQGVVEAERALARFDEVEDRRNRIRLRLQSIGRGRPLSLEELNVDGCFEELGKFEVRRARFELSAVCDRAREALERQRMMRDDSRLQGRIKAARHRARRASAMAAADMRWKIRRGSITVQGGKDAQEAMVKAAEEAAFRAAEAMGAFGGPNAGEQDEECMSDYEDSDTDVPASERAGAPGRTYQLRLRPTRNELETVLEEPRWRQMLLVSARGELAEAPVRFLAAAAEYKRRAINPRAGESRGELAGKVFHTYLQATTRLPSVPMSLRNRVKEQVRMNPDPGVFDAVEKIVRRGMLKGTFRRFWRSKRGRRYRMERILALGLPEWSIEQIGKLAGSKRLDKVVWMQAGVRGLLARMRAMGGSLRAGGQSARGKGGPSLLDVARRAGRVESGGDGSVAGAGTGAGASKSK